MTTGPAQRRTNHDLDSLVGEFGAFKEAVGHNEMYRGERGMSLSKRAQTIEHLVRHLSQLAPATAGEPVLDPATIPIDQLLAGIHNARESILPRRKPHHPKYHVEVNDESDRHIDFMRQFTLKWRDGDKAYMQQHFPHLRHTARVAWRMVGIYDLTAQLERDYNRTTIQHPLTPTQRMELFDGLNGTVQAILEKWPQVGNTDERAKLYMNDEMYERYATALSRVRYELNRLPAAFMPNRVDPVDDLQKAINELRYESCAFGQRIFRQIDAAYLADKALLEKNRAARLGARDPIRQELPMLDDVYQARWALLADDIEERVKSNRAVLEAHGTLAKRTKAEAEQERRATHDGNGQGRLDF